MIWVYLGITFLDFSVKMVWYIFQGGTSLSVNKLNISQDLCYSIWEYACNGYLIVKSYKMLCSYW